MAQTAAYITQSENIITNTVKEELNAAIICITRFCHNLWPIRSQSSDLIRVHKMQEFLYRIYLINHYPVSWCIRISSYSSSSVWKSAVNFLYFLLENFSCRRRSSLSNRSQFSSSFNCCTFRSSRLWKLEFLSIVKVKKYFLISEMQLNAIVNRYASPTTRYLIYLAQYTSGLTRS